MQSRPTLTMDSSYKEICARLANLTTSNICDALPDVRLMDTKIKPVGDNHQCIGRAYTVNSAQDSLSTMQALDDLQAFLALLDPTNNDIVPTILMIASCGAPYALAGGMCVNTAKYKGFGGVMTDGPCRDIEEIRASQLSFFAKGKCAKSGPKNKIGTIRQKIEFGGIEVNPGDIILADIDGGVVMSKEESIKAIPKAEEIQEKESVALQKIKDGAKFSEICNIDQYIDDLQNGIASRLRLTC